MIKDSLFHKKQYDILKKTLKGGLSPSTSAFEEVGTIVVGIAKYHNIEQWESQSPLAKFASAAYHHDPTVGNYKINTKFSATDHAVYVSDSNKKVVIAISGTRAINDPRYKHAVKSIALAGSQIADVVTESMYESIGFHFAHAMKDTDFAQDAMLVFGMTRTSRYEEIKRDVEHVYDYYTSRGYDVELTGHSLGGRQAMDISSDFTQKGEMLKTTVFEPAFTWIDKYKSKVEIYDNVTAYVNTKDPISSYLSVRKEQIGGIDVITEETQQPQKPGTETQPQQPEQGTTTQPVPSTSTNPEPSSDGNTYHTPGAPTTENPYWSDPWGIDHSMHDISWAYPQVKAGTPSSVPVNPIQAPPAADANTAVINQSQQTTTSQPTTTTTTTTSQPTQSTTTTAPTTKKPSGDTTTKQDTGLHWSDIKHAFHSKEFKQVAEIFGASAAVATAVVAGAAAVPYLVGAVGAAGVVDDVANALNNTVNAGRAAQAAEGGAKVAAEGESIGSKLGRLWDTFKNGTRAFGDWIKGGRRVVVDNRFSIVTPTSANPLGRGSSFSVTYEDLIQMHDEYLRELDGLLTILPGT